MKFSVLIILSIFFAFNSPLIAQQTWYTKAGIIRFESKAPLEDIEATNKSVTAIYQPKQGKIQFSVLMRGFEFRKALMQEHFNENYVESHKYPRASFEGEVLDFRPADISSLPGAVNVQVKGRLTIHGVTQMVDANGKVEMQNGKLQLSSVFQVRVSDYKISIPGIVKDKISNTITIFVNCNLQPLK